MAANDIPDHLALATVAKEGPWLPTVADIPMVDFLSGIADLIGKRTKLRADYLNVSSTELDANAVLSTAQRAIANLIETFTDPASIGQLLAGQQASQAADLAALPARHRKPAADVIAAVHRQSDRLADIVASATHLGALIAEYRRDTVPPDRRVDHLKREFLQQAVEAWTFLTGKRPPASRTGPFSRFACALWFAGGLPSLGDDPEGTLGAAIERQLKTTAHR